MTLGVTKRKRMMRRADRWWRSAYHRQLIYEADPVSLDNLMRRGDGIPSIRNLISDDPIIEMENQDE